MQRLQRIIRTSSFSDFARTLLFSLPALALAFFFTPAQALTFNVNSTLDTADAVLGNGTCATSTGVCTLRAAIQEANALSGAVVHTINVPAGTYAVAQLDIVHPVNIVGAGTATTTITGSGANRVFYIRTNTTTATGFSDLTVTGGKAPSGAGMLINGANLLTGVFMAMPVNLNRVVVNGNAADSAVPRQGGGINVYNGARLTLTDSVVAGNAAPSGGGGIYLTAATATISGSTIQDNSINAGAGGAGIAVTGASSLSMQQSTVSGNLVAAGGLAGAIFVDQSTLSIDSTTIANNAGLEQVKLVSPVGASITRTIIAAPPTIATVNCSGVTAAHSGGNNLDDGTTCNFPANANFVNTPALLAALANNGGPSETHALLANSPAINGSTNAGQPASDQRGTGFPRVQNFFADIGSYETTLSTTSTIQVSKFGTGSGTISGAGIACGADCIEVLPTGNFIILSAAPSVGSTFVGWTGGGCTGTGNCTVTLSGATFVQAQFAANALLTVNKSGSGGGTITGTGINCGADCSESLATGSTVTLTATPDVGSYFSNWIGGGCVGAAPCTVTLSANTTVTARFFPTIDVTVTKSGSGQGTVTGLGIVCGADCAESYAGDETTTLVAAASVGSVFVGWSGAGCTGTASCLINLLNNVTVNAQFDLAPTAQLTVSLAGTGTGSVSATGINCGVDCSENYPLNTTVTLTASAAVGSSFVGWSGAGCVGTGSCAVVMAAANTVQARFDLIPIPNRTLTTTKTGAGTGAITGVGINCGADCTESVASNTSITLTATPAVGSSFAAWSGAGCSGTGTCIITLTVDSSVNALFDLIPIPNRTLTTTKTGAGTGTITGVGINCGADCTESVASGTSITLTATPAPGSTFAGWSGAGCSGTGACTITLTVDSSVNALFDLIPLPQLTVTFSGNGAGSINATGLNCSANCNSSYALNTTVILTATAASGSSFLGWTGGGCSGTGTCSVTLAQSQSVSAQFGLAPINPQAAAVPVPIGGAGWLALMLIGIIAAGSRVARQRRW